MKLTEEEWQSVEEKYTKLISYAANRVYFDTLKWSYDDVCQEIKLSVINCIEVFLRKENLNFEVAWLESGIHQYIKTTIWNTKNNIGLRIRKESETFDGSLCPVDSRFSVDESTLNPGNSQDISDHSASMFENTPLFSFDSENPLHGVGFNKEQDTLIKTVCGDYSFFKPNGRINIRKLSTHLKWPSSKTNKILKSIRHLLTINGI